MCPNDGTALMPAADERDDGKTPGMVLGHYRLTEEIGSGGAGSVWRAEHVRARTAMAIKILDPAKSSPATIERFFSDAKTVNEIGHPNIIEVEDFVVSDDDSSHVVMELLEGRNLGQVIEEEGKLDPERVVHIGAQVGNALAAVAEVGTAHRALTPDDIVLVERDGDPDFCKVRDFGVAQIHGKQDLDASADIYSLGVVLYQALTGEVPVAGNVVPPSQRIGAPVPAALESAILRSLRGNGEGFRDMREFTAALTAELESEQAPAAAAELPIDAVFELESMPVAGDEALDPFSIGVDATPPPVDEAPAGVDEAPARAVGDSSEETPAPDVVEPPAPASVALEAKPRRAMRLALLGLLLLAVAGTIAMYSFTDLLDF